jgi:hypothetical protein
LEASAWERRKRRILRDAFADVARDREWTPGEFEREVQAALDGFAPVELAVRVMCRQGRTLREVAAWIAAELGVDPGELLADFEHQGVTLRGGRR